MRRNILNVTANMHRWKLSALAAAAFVTAAMTSTDAAALALGPLRVESALGENLRAEIAIPQATAAELNQLIAHIASPEVFRAQGMDYSSAARAIQIQLVRKPDGTASLRLTSNAPLQDPFVDVVVETQWSTGHLVRSYTLLLDPPAAQRSAPAPTIAPQVTSTAPAAAPPSPSAARPRPAPAPAAAAAPASPAPAAPAAASDDAVRVRAGDTASRLASANRPSGVSLDQMLVAMLRSNPQAFINGNVNRIRAGAVVQVPNREQALETSAPQARQIVAAQSRDFNAYRRSLASKAPQAAVQAADRSASGQVQAHVADARPAADTPDKLTLSKGSIASTAAAEAQLAAQKQADDQDNRLSELQRNLTELNALAGTTAGAESTGTPAPAAASADAAAATAAESAQPTTPTLEVASATAAANAAADNQAAPASDASATLDSTAPASEAAAPTANAQAAPELASAPPSPPPAAAAPTAPAAPITEPGLTDTLLDNPLVPAGAGLVALLLGLLGYSAWKRRRAAQATQDPVLGDSQLQADSFFGSSGGQQVDTSSSDDGASTMAYAPSQLDGGGDVDPVAEADVYLAYGRDVQAEEILKEALRSQPERLSVHVKLAEIYVKRHDIRALEATARELQAVSHGQGPEWQRVLEMGRQMDPAHPFFAAAGGAMALGATAATATVAAASVAAPLSDIPLHLDLPDDGVAPAAAAATAAAANAPQPSDDDFAALELPSTWDSDIDLSATSSAPQDPPTLVQDTLMDESPSAHDLGDLDLDLSGFDLPAAPAAAAPAPSEDTFQGLDFDLDMPAAAQPASNAATTPPAPSDLDFDLGSLDLDLGPTAAPAAPAEPVHNLADDSLSTKLDLAQEFNAIGDSEGARALVEEVLAQASGPLKDRAHKLLSELD